MIAVHLIAGDNNGGPYAHATLTLKRGVESLTDAEVAEWRESVRALFVKGYGEEPESIIIYADESA